jgi:peptide/nickel transport system ATP-binding protein
MSVAATGDPALLEIDDLQVEFSTHDGIVHAVNGVNLFVRRGETLAVVGESGSGKSVSALSVMGLIDKPGRIAGGNILFEGTSLRGLSEREYRRLRGGDLAMIFQDPLSSLNPAFRVGDQIAEALLQHTYGKKGAARRQAAHLLEIVGIPKPGERARDYPHQFSGGMPITLDYPEFQSHQTSPNHSASGSHRSSLAASAPASLPHAIPPPAGASRAT